MWLGPHVWEHGPSSETSYGAPGHRDSEQVEGTEATWGWSVHHRQGWARAGKWVWEGFAGSLRVAVGQRQVPEW